MRGNCSQTIKATGSGKTAPLVRILSLRLRRFNWLLSRAYNAGINPTIESDKSEALYVEDASSTNSQTQCAI